MAKVSFPVDYFINTEEDGNLSLGTIKERVIETVMLFESGDTILLTSLDKIVSNEEELLNAIEEHLETKKGGKK